MTDCFLFFSSPLPLLLLYFRSIHFCLRTVVAAEEKKKEKKKKKVPFATAFCPSPLHPTLIYLTRHTYIIPEHVA